MSCSQTYDRDGSIPIEQRELEYDYLDIKPTTLGPGGLPYYILDEEIAFTIEDLTHRVYNGVSLNTWDVIERLMSERR